MLFLWFYDGASPHAVLMAGTATLLGLLILLLSIWAIIPTRVGLSSTGSDVLSSRCGIQRRLMPAHGTSVMVEYHDVSTETGTAMTYVLMLRRDDQAKALASYDDEATAKTAADNVRHLLATAAADASGPTGAVASQSLAMGRL